MEKDLYVYEVTCDHNKFGSGTITVYLNPSDAFKHAKVLYMNMKNLYMEKEEKGEGKAEFDDKELVIKWYSNENEDIFVYEKITYWVKNRKVYSTCQVE